MEWVNNNKRMNVLSNVKNLEDAMKTIEYKGDGIGQLSTNEYLTSKECISLMRGMFLCKDDVMRSEMELQLLSLHKRYLLQIMKLFSGKPICVRLIDLCLPAFFQDMTNEDWIDLSDCTLTPKEECRAVVDQFLSTKNMEREREKDITGFRGSRLVLILPRILSIQTRAILGAAHELRHTALDIRPDILIPKVVSASEASSIANIIKREADQLFSLSGFTVPYRIGASLEAVGGCLHSAAISKENDISFLSIDTDAITSSSLGSFTGEDKRTFIEDYQKHHVLTTDPFTNTDRVGVAKLIQSAVDQAHKKQRIGVSGTHIDLLSLLFFESLQVHYVTCQPDDVSKAKIAAAQARVRWLMNDERCKDTTLH